MPLRNVLAQRLSELMRARVTLDTQEKVAARAGVGQSTIQRILSCDVSTTVDVLERLADAFDIAPADLLSADDADTRMLSMFRRLDDGDRARVLGFMQVTIEAQAARTSLEFSRSRPVPSEALAGIQRASSGPVVSDSTTTDRSRDGTPDRQRGSSK